MKNVSLRVTYAVIAAGFIVWLVIFCKLSAAKDDTAAKQRATVIRANRAAAHEVSEAARKTVLDDFAGSCAVTDYARTYADGIWAYNAEIKSLDGTYMRLTGTSDADDLGVGDMLKGRTVFVDYFKADDVTGGTDDAGNPCSVTDPVPCRHFTDSPERFMDVTVK